ncbi:hypothetical protein ABMX92_18260 [Vibrio vulnificus]|uniref:hypothetical protein n=1 Tax=Vibrio vulnificus TaxID=672 RepID=UPI001EB84FDB|nr:hypothetical protein [Vibrio vulnificus]EHK9000894.1 hypothetical protein [Vibrio vulnificus]
MKLFFKANIKFHNEDWWGPSIYCSKWVPDENDHRLIIDIDEDIKMEMYFDTKAHENEVPPDEVYKNLKIPLSQVNVSFVFNSLDPMLGQYILEKKTDDEKLNEQSLEVAKILHTNIGKYVNRLLEYVRNVKGQYWLKEIELDQGAISSDILKMETIVSEDQINWSRYVVQSTHYVHVYMSGERTEVVEADWQGIQEFVAGNSRTDLVLELIANANFLFSSGHRRSAVIEICTALEVALSKFEKEGDYTLLELSKETNRVDFERIGQQIKHLGLSTSIRVLLPLIFSEREVSKDILDASSAALQIRNNVVHQGQRDVAEHRLRPLMPKVAELCKTLISYEKGT